MSYSEVKRLPIRYRHWYLDRLVKHFNQQNDRNKKPVEEDSKNSLAEFEKQVNSKLL